MNSFVSWADIRDEHVKRAGGEAAVESGKRELLAEASHTVPSTARSWRRARPSALP